MYPDVALECYHKGIFIPKVYVEFKSTKIKGPSVAVKQLMSFLTRPNMAGDIAKYLRECLACAKWTHAGRTIPLSPIKVEAPFNLFGADSDSEDNEDDNKTFAGVGKVEVQRVRSALRTC